MNPERDIPFIELTNHSELKFRQSNTKSNQPVLILTVTETLSFQGKTKYLPNAPTQFYFDLTNIFANTYCKCHFILYMVVETGENAALLADYTLGNGEVV